MNHLQAKNKEQQEFVRSKLTDVGSWVGIVNKDRVELDGWVDFDQMAEIVDYLREINNVDTTIKVQFDAIGIGHVTKYERE